MKGLSVISLFAFGIILAMGVIYLRSMTYKVGYEIASLKKTEDQLRKESRILKSKFERLGQDVKTNLLTEKSKDGLKLFILPESHQVLRPEN